MLRMTDAAIIFCVSIALGQPLNPKLTFEVASIKPAAPQAMGRLQGSVDGGPGTPAPGRIRFTDMPLKVLIMRAYDVHSFQVSGPLGWIASDSTSAPRSPTVQPRKMPGSCFRTCWQTGSS